MTVRLEHANLIVRDIDTTIRFLQTAFPEFKIRHDSAESNAADDRWVHIGLDETYLALNQATEEPGEQGKPNASRPWVNHLGYEVDDADALRERMLAAGYQESTPPYEHSARKRVYFFDPDGNEWEFVGYLTDDRAKRHDYSS